MGKQYSFKLDYKKQRLLLFNTLLLIYAVAQLFYFFNFWINFDTLSFDKLKAIHPSDFAMHLNERTYALFCTSFVCMIVVSVAVIFMEWTVVAKEKRYKVYRISGCLLYTICGILQLIAVIFGSSDYCKHMDRTYLDNGGNYFCHMQFVGVHLLSIMLPLVVLSVDIMDCWRLFFGNVRIRVGALHFFVSLSCLLFYCGYYNYWKEEENVYTKIKMMGLLMIAFSFLFEAVMSPLFVYLQSIAFSNISNFISTVLIIIGVALVVDVNNLNINIAEWTLFLPICCLVAYEIQLL